MSTKAERIAAKLAHIDDQIGALQRNEKVVARIGGLTVQNLGEEIKLHQRCRATLAWASGKTNAEIQAKIDQLVAGLPPGAMNCKYGDLRGLTLEAFETIRQIELLEVALGTHPGVK